MVYLEKGMAEDERIFTTTFYALGQRQFEEALRKEDYESAQDILEGMLYADTPLEMVSRARVLIEGYRALVEELLGEMNAAKEREEELREELMNCVGKSDLENLLNSN